MELHQTPRPQSPISFWSITQKVPTLSSRNKSDTCTSLPHAASFLDLPAAIQEKILAMNLLTKTTLTLTSARAGNKGKTIPSTRKWGPEMPAMRALLDISPKLLDNAISMIASRTTVKTYGNNFHKAMSAIPVEFWASVEHLCLKTTYPISVDDLFIYSPRLRTVEVGLEWLTMGSGNVEIVTNEKFREATDEISKARMKARIDQVVVEKTRAILAHNDNDCVRRAMQDEDETFKLLITASFDRKSAKGEEATALTGLIYDAVIDLGGGIVLKGHYPRG